MNSFNALWTALLVVLIGTNALAGTENVDCDKGKSLQEAIDKALPGSEIEVSGTCHEFIVFDSTRRDLIVYGAPGAAIASPDSSRFTIDVNQATGIQIAGLAISGGFGGVVFRSGARGVVGGSWISASDIGVWTLNNARLALLDSAIRDAATGIDLLSGASAFIRNTTLQNTSKTAFLARLGSAFRVFGLTVAQTTGKGVEVSGNAAGTISGLNIALDSPGLGVEVRSGGSLEVDNGTLNNAALFASSGFLGLTGVVLDGGGAAGFGISTESGSVRIQEGTIQGFQSGILANNSASVELRGVTLEGGGSTGFGIETTHGSSVLLKDGSAVRGFDFGVVASNGGIAEINASSADGANRGLWVTGGAADVQGAVVSGGDNGAVVESGRITVHGSTIQNGLGLNYSSSAEIISSQLFGNPSLSPGFSSSVRVQDTMMESVFGVRDCTLQFQDGTVATGLIHLDVGCALDFSPNDPSTYSVGDIECGEMDVTTQVRLSGVTNVGAIANCKVEP